MYSIKCPVKVSRFISTVFGVLLEYKPIAYTFRMMVFKNIMFFISVNVQALSGRLILIPVFEKTRST